MCREELEALKGSVDVRSLVESYGGSVFVDDGSALRSSCVVHGGQNPTSLIYYKNIGVFKCYSCAWKGDVFALIQEKELCSFPEAVEKAGQFSHLTSNGYTSQNKPAKKGWVSAFSSAYREGSKNKPIDSSLVEKAAEYRPHPYVTSGKFEAQTIEYFGLGYSDQPGPFKHRVIIPIHDEDGNLVGFSGRDMTGIYEESMKYRIKKGFKKGYTLYNLHRAKEHIGRKSPLVLAEGFGQVWRLHEAGIPTGVALMGKDLTSEQYHLLLRYTTSVVLALDFDAKGKEGTADILEKLEGKIDVSVLVSPYGDDKDLAELSVEQVQEIFANRVSPEAWLGKKERRV